MMKRLSVVLLVAAALASAPAFAQSPYHTALAACRAAAGKALDPTDFKCDWKTVLRGAPGSALTGKFDARSNGMAGAMTILESAEGPAIIHISTVIKRPNAPTCSVQVTATRGDDDTLVAKPGDSDGCVISVRSSGPNLASVASKSCGGFCGVNGSFDGQYKLRLK